LVQAWRARGDVHARSQGGDRRSHCIEAQAGFLLDQIERTPDVTLAELQAMLRERGVPVDRHAMAVLRLERPHRRAILVVAPVSSMKHRAGLRQAESLAPKSRRPNKDALWQAIAKAMDAFTPAECTNYFRNSGYDPE
jgi:hypothetical protein